jgi:hypothetical protein
MLLEYAAKIAKDAGCRAVEDVMDGRSRYSPWEISEVWLQIAIAQALHKNTASANSPSGWRIHDEFPESEITNVSSVDPHPIDIVVLHPLSATEDAWSDCPALGIIEVKKGWTNLKGDARRLKGLIEKPPMPDVLPLRWVMLLVFINGRDEAAVFETDRRVADVVKDFSLSPVLPCQPKKAKAHSANSVDDVWFDVICYGEGA